MRRGWGRICDFKPIRLSETGRAVRHSLASVEETSLLGSVNLDFVLLGFQTCTAVARFSLR